MDLVRFRFDEEIRFLGRIALEAEALGDLVALARIVDQHRERARVRGSPREKNCALTGNTRRCPLSRGEFTLLHRRVVAGEWDGLDEL